MKSGGSSCVVASMMARYYRLAPPGIIFMVMAAAIAAYTPVFLSEIRQRVGLVTLGALFACIVAFLYSLYRVRRVAPSLQIPWRAWGLPGYCSRYPWTCGRPHSS